MSNDYFNHSNPQARNTLARAETVNATNDEIVAGFDKLPAELALKQDRVTYATDTGAANAYVVTLTHAPASYVAGLRVSMKVANANTGASTVNVNGLGVKSIKRFNGAALAANDLMVGAVVDLRYDGANFILASQHGASETNAAASATAAAASTAAAADSASAAASSATAASGSATAASASQAAAATSATNAASSEAAASASATAAAASEAAASSSASTASTAASSASASATNAASSASTASAQATNAATSATNAASSASAAASSATAASGSATAAAASATAAASAVANTNSIWCGTAGGTDTIALTPSPALGSYGAGITIRFKTAGANTGAVTVNVSGLGAKSLKDASGTALVASAMASGEVIEATYDGTEFRKSGGWARGGIMSAGTSVAGAGFTTGAADAGKNYRCSGTFTVAFAAAATLGNGWCAAIHNASTGTITLDPSGSELINGVDAVALANGQWALVSCDGSALYALLSSAPAVSVATTWNPSDKGGDVTLSNSNRDALMTGYDGVRSVSGRSSGTAYGEITFTASSITNAKPTLGLALGTQGIDNLPNLNGAITYSGYSGVVSRYGSTVQTSSTYGTGSVIGVHADFNLLKCWIAIDGSSINGDPIAKTGGFSLVSGIHYLFAAHADGGSTENCTARINTGQASWSHAPTSGFDLGW
jgi:hypothetical protein